MVFIATLLKYIFVVGLGVEVLLIVRALFNLAREKARATEPAAAKE
jgi:hypothetical protein